MLYIALVPLEPHALDQQWYQPVGWAGFVTLSENVAFPNAKWPKGSKLTLFRFCGRFLFLSQPFLPAGQQARRVEISY